MASDPVDGTAAQRLTARLGGTWVEETWADDSFGYCDCPVHSGAGLVVRNGDRAVLVTCQEGCDRRAIIEVLRRRGLWETPPSPAPRQPNPGRAADNLIRTGQCPVLAAARWQMIGVTWRLADGAGEIWFTPCDNDNFVDVMHMGATGDSAVSIADRIPRGLGAGVATQWLRKHHLSRLPDAG